MPPLPPAPALGRSLLLVFALPSILQAFMHAPAISLLQGIYAKESGIALIALGTAVMTVRIFDIFSDLLIGYLSDRTAHRGGSRKSWIAAGTVVTVFALWFLFRPPAGVSVEYYAFWFLMANIGWSLVEIPYRSWSLEFTSDYVQRQRVVTWIAFAGLIGALLFYGVAPLGKALGALDTMDLNMEMLGFTAIVVALILPPLTFYTLWRVPAGLGQASVVEKKPADESFAVVWASIIGNQPLIRLLLCFTITNFMSGLSQGVSLLYFTNYLGLSSSLNAVLLLTLPLGLLGVPFCGWVATKYPRQRVWAFAMGLTGIAFSGQGLLPPHPRVEVLAALICVVFFCITATLVVAPAILGDIVDYGKEKFGVNRAGVYLSFKAQILKGVNAVAGGAGLIFLGWMGFDASKSGADLSPDAVSALKWVVAWLPGLGMVITAAVLWIVPIGRMKPPKGKSHDDEQLAAR